MLDPSEPSQKKDTGKTIGALTFALLFQWIIGMLILRFQRLAPTLLGLYIGYIFTIFVIVAVNGIEGVIEDSSKASSQDAVEPGMAIIYQSIGAFLGGLLGFCYSAFFIALV